MSEKIELKVKIQAVDEGMIGLWDMLDAEQQKALKGELFILNRYISSAKASREVQEHYLLAVNEFFNKNWNVLQKEHSKLLWMLLCMTAYDKDKPAHYYHEWVGAKKTGGNTNNKRAKILESLYPNKKYDEIELLASLTSDKELKELARDHGWEEAEIAKALKK